MAQRRISNAAALAILVGLWSYSRKARARPSLQIMQWTDREMRAFIEHVEPIGVPLDASLAVYTAESGLDPKASSGIAWGLAQLTATTLKEIGWTRPAREFGTLDVVQQAPWIAKLQAAQVRAIGFVPKTALDLYVANFAPAAAKTHADVIYSAPSQAYLKNSALDLAHKGYISRDDLSAFVGRAKQTVTYQRAVQQAKRLGASSLLGSLTA